MTIKFLSDAPPFYGSHTGYQLLAEFVQSEIPGTSVLHAPSHLPLRMATRLSTVFRRPRLWAAEHYYYHFFTRRLHPDSVNHILAFEPHHEFWNRWEKAPANLVTTLHHPSPQRLPARVIDTMKRVSSAIVLSRQNVAYLQEELGIERVRFIRHGVDTDFFRPAARPPRPRRLIFIGRVFRNTAMLQRVVCRLAEERPDLRFDLVVPLESRSHSDFRLLLDHPCVEWHANISDEALCRLYQDAYLLLMPLDQASANNSVVEALACGLPVVTTDVGGVADYAGGTVYPVVPNNDDDAMADLIIKYIENTGWRQSVALNCREFAEQHLDWNRVARQHIEFYSEVCHYPLNA